jgi:hypothetical protein
VHGLVTDALALLDALTSDNTDADADTGELGDAGAAPDTVGQAGLDPAGQALALLALLAGQDVEWITDEHGGGAGMSRIARKVAHDRIISTVDPETRHAHKTRSRKHDGFKAHVAAEPDTGIITNAMLTKATGQGTGDAAAGAVVLAGDDSFTGPVDVLGDSADGTGDLLADLQRPDMTR